MPDPAAPHRPEPKLASLPGRARHSGLPGVWLDDRSGPAHDGGKRGWAGPRRHERYPVKQSRVTPIPYPLGRRQPVAPSRLFGWDGGRLAQTVAESHVVLQAATVCSSRRVRALCQYRLVTPDGTDQVRREARVDESFVEYCEVGVADPLRQGDVLESVDVEASMWRRHLIVLTADCDFAYAKHQGRVTCVPLLAAEEYLSEMQIPKIRERLVKGPLKEMRNILSTSGGPDISERRLRDWASEEAPADIVMRLELKEGTAQDATAALEAIRMIDAPAQNLKQGVDSLVGAQLVGASPPKREIAVKKVVTGLREAYARPPGDALFLTAIGPGHEGGYFAYLRHIEQILEPEISLGPSRREVRYRRISRMCDRFAYALIQRFAMVFMSIGLPKQYEDLRDLYSETLGDNFT